MQDASQRWNTAEACCWWCPRIKAILSVVGAGRELADDWVQRHAADTLVVRLSGSQAEIVRDSLQQSNRAGWMPYCLAATDERAGIRPVRSSGAGGWI